MTDTSADQLINNLRFRLSWVTIADYFLSRQPKPEELAVLAAMRDVDRRAVEMLSLALRRLGAAPGTVEIQRDLLQQARTRRTPTARLLFIRQGIETSLRWYEMRIRDGGPHTTLWQQCYDDQKQLLDQFADLFRQLPT